MDSKDKIIIKNLSDGNLYSEEEIAFLADVSVEEVRGVLNDPSIFKSCGDGSGVIYIMDIKNDTIVDGPGFRNSIYCAKCNIHCKQCHNPVSWSIRNGHPITINEAVERLSISNRNVTFTGGEASLQDKAIIKIMKILKTNNPDISFWLYTGKKINELSKEILYFVDTVVDGQFVIEKKNLDCVFRGSTNQRILQKRWIDMENFKFENTTLLYEKMLEIAQLNIDIPDHKYDRDVGIKFWKKNDEL